MAIKFKEISRETEKVVDTNPETWMSAANHKFKLLQYQEALNDTNQARIFANGEKSITDRSYILDMKCYYAMGNNTKARKVKEQYTSYEIINLMYNDVDAVASFWEKDKAAWRDIWESIITRCFGDSKYGIIEKYIDHITDKILFKNSDNSFCEFCLRHGTYKLLYRLYKCGYDIRRFSENGDNALIMIVKSWNNWNEITAPISLILDNKINDINYRNNENQSVISIAAEMNCVDCFNALIKYKPEINYIDNYGNSPLHYAVFNNNISIINSLISNNADVNIRNNGGQAPLHIAVWDGMTTEGQYKAKNNSVVSLLIRHGANVNMSINEDGTTPLFIAASVNNIEAMSTLIKNNANINYCNSDTINAAYVALYNKNYDAFNYLIQHGIDINHRFTYGDFKDATLLHMIASKEHWNNPYNDMWKALLKKHADVNVKDFAGYTPLMYSLKHRWYISDELDMARALIDAGASVNVKSDNGETVDDILSMNNIKRSKLFNKESSNFFMNLFQ